LQASEIDKFLYVFVLNKKLLFGDAAYTLNKNWQVNLHRRHALPSEEDVNKLKTYTVNRISAVVNDTFHLWDFHSYAELRDLTVCRLTLFNAQHGSEPARLLTNEWNNIRTDIWLNKNQKGNSDDLQMKLLHDMKIPYQTGKGVSECVSEQFLNGTSAQYRLCSSVIFVTKIKTRTRITGRLFHKTRIRITVIKKTKTK